MANAATHRVGQVRRQGLAAMLAVALALIAVSVLMVRLDLDRSLSARFFDPDTGWYLGRRPLWQWLYRYGTIPGLVLSLGALGGLWASWRRPSLAAWRRPLLLVVLTALLGAGLLVNAVLKPYWGRPRPGHTTEFGGYWDYRPVWPPGIPGRGQSFPCGHCTMGYLFLTLVVFRRQSAGLAVAGVIVGVALGGALSLARILQGAHFLSDTLWSLGIVVLTAQALYYLVLGIPLPARPRAAPARRPGLLLAAGSLLALAVLAGFLTRRPFQEVFLAPLPLTAGDRRVVVRTDFVPDAVQVLAQDRADGRVLIHSSGFGWVSAATHVQRSRRREGATLTLEYRIMADGYFSELTHRIEVMVPRYLMGRVAVEFQPMAPAAVAGRRAPAALAPVPKGQSAP